MNEVRVSSGYPAHQWAKAFQATAHPDPAVRDRAAERVRRWDAVIAGMHDGALTIGDRAPVKGLPSWVTLEVAQGGLATGRAVAESDLNLEERALARRQGIPATRAALFAYHLTDDGLTRLRDQLTDGRYALTAPESAALPIVAWLLRTANAYGVNWF